MKKQYVLLLALTAFLALGCDQVNAPMKDFISHSMYDVVLVGYEIVPPPEALPGDTYTYTYTETNGLITFTGTADPFDLILHFRYLPLPSASIFYYQFSPSEDISYLGEATLDVLSGTTLRCRLTKDTLVPREDSMIQEMRLQYIQFNPGEAEQPSPVYPLGIKICYSPSPSP